MRLARPTTLEHFEQLSAMLSALAAQHGAECSPSAQRLQDDFGNHYEAVLAFGDRTVNAFAVWQSFYSVEFTESGVGIGRRLMAT